MANLCIVSFPDANKIRGWNNTPAAAHIIPRRISAGVHAGLEAFSSNVLSDPYHTGKAWGTVTIVAQGDFAPALLWPEDFIEP